MKREDLGWNLVRFKSSTHGKERMVCACRSTYLGPDSRDGKKWLQRGKVPIFKGRIMEFFNGW